MRFSLIVASAATLLLAASNPLPAATDVAPAGVPAIAAVNILAQDQVQPPGRVDVNIGVEDNGTVWYANPVWIAIGLLAIVILGLLIGMAARGGGSGGGSTIVK
jgi:hypothetical protein